MNQRFIKILVTLLGIALVCIILIQLIWIRQAYKQNETRFESSVKEAMDQLAERLAEQETFSIISKDIQIVPPHIPDEMEFARQKRKLRVVYNNQEINMDTTSLSVPIHMPRVIPHHQQQEIEVIINDSLRQFSDKEFFHAQELDSLIQAEKALAKTEKLASKMSGMYDVLKKMVIEVSNENVPIEKRLDKNMIHRELQKFLENKGVDIPFEFAVVQAANDSMTAVRSPGFKQEFIHSPFVVSLFPDDLILKPHKLLVFFEGQKAFIYHSFSWLMMASLLFTIAIMLAFALTLHLLFRQKKLSDMKSDFINNLTHEFKTPIATIAVAIDSIENPKVLNDPEKILPITKMIREENIRMNSHVEQVLQIAMLDRGNLKMAKDDIDVSLVLLRAIESIKLQVNRKNGSIAIDLKAPNHLICGDEMHLYNLLLNLLDNANKYTPHEPRIKVQTLQKDHELSITIEDNGPGMDKENQHRIFDRFYRVPTGNIHSVKGFGLGLSYVKAICEAHGGRVFIAWSEPGRGSCFEVRLPLKNNKSILEGKF